MIFRNRIVNVLVVGDNNRTIDLISIYLNDQINNLEVIHSPSFQGVQKILQNEKEVNAIIFDVSLPWGNEEKLLHDIVYVSEEIPVIILVESEDLEFGIKALSAGISDFLLKEELSPASLFKSLACSIERKRMGIHSQKQVKDRKKCDREITKAIVSAQARERKEIGSELHDNVNQLLLASKINLRMAKEETKWERSLEWIDKTNNYLSLAIDEIRNLSHRLIPAAFMRDSLVQRFGQLLNSMNIEQKYQINFTHNRIVESKLQDDIKLNLYRILQEQVNNIIKHSGASVIEVNVNMQKESILVHIKDNGKGLPQDPLIMV